MKKYKRSDMSEADVLAQLEKLGTVLEIVGYTARIEVSRQVGPTSAFREIIEVSTTGWYDLDLQDDHKEAGDGRDC